LDNLSEAVCLIFITLSKIKEKPTKEAITKGSKLGEEMAKKGFKILSNYWTLGRFDSVVIFEAPTEKDAMKFLVEAAKLGTATSETLVAIPREEAIKLL
jgi:uncharacterized protein with GYD domain